ncbi:oligoendopeptidase, pepF/M3 family [Halolactibacillus miurensis]|uniref:Oligoendopeptidase, pepF/M3 family n=1 Tax=Halolactibacillus miurensis TaxID=306541 RepID=A0A1I6P794_9BACI|nr:oligoendopeptidase, pepF/M3 family [Halolactibacillus miurensis]
MLNYAQTWDLDAIFSGGTASPALKEKLQTIAQELDAFKANVNQFTNRLSDFKQLLTEQEKLEKALLQASTFANMAHDANTKDTYAPVIKGEIMVLFSELNKVGNHFTQKLVDLDEETFAQFLADDDLVPMNFVLTEQRKKGARLLSEREETLIAELNKDGLAAWSQVYDTIISTMTIPWTNKQGETVNLSIGQAMNRMSQDNDPEVRKQLFTAWEEAFNHQAPIFADVLNHLDGYRMTLQEKHQYKDHLEEPLEYNRMSKATLEAMWQAVSDNKQPFVTFLKKKQQLLQLDSLAWQDVDAPLSVGDHEAMTFTYDEACDFIIKHFSAFPKLTAFTKHALENRWVEAEDRNDKRPGGYCTSLPEFDESRIFMTFTGSASDTSTLAHELGHAFHSDVLTDVPYLNQHYAMNVAETASTFAETIIANATVQSARSDEEKLSLLNNKLEGATAMFMNIHARFIFEDNFYKARKNGVVSHEQLSKLMTVAQKEAFHGALNTYHPHFWSSKLHFFIDDVPFYNFPYTFGYLFSLGIYAEYLKQPKNFEEKYIALLKDTGAMTVEDLAMKHLGVDVTNVDFWAEGVKLMAKDVDQFIALADQLENN